MNSRCNYKQIAGIKYQNINVLVAMHAISSATMQGMKQSQPNI
jgi:hypothetical protein